MPVTRVTAEDVLQESCLRRRQVDADTVEHVVRPLDGGALDRGSLG
ncbi:hypothetical protein [Streptomyces sp. NPDC053069]